MEQIAQLPGDSLIFSSQEILKHKSACGQKAYRLAHLAEEGYPVPRFMVIGKEGAEALSQATIETSLYKNVVEEIYAKLPALKYAVRSNAFIEDGDAHSHAGAFTTKLGVQQEDLAQAIQEVIKDALEKGSTTKENPFSVIIQEYISPDTAGVLFTRDPQGEYARVIEWKEGGGAEVVDGEGSHTLSFSCKSIPTPSPFQGFEELISLSEKIEKELSFPQDIEWCIKDGEVWILQTRPITTLTKEQYKGFCFLDIETFLNEYYFDAESLQDSFGNAPLLARDILDRCIYGSGGAIEKAYASLGVSISMGGLVRTFGCSAYIDKERELKQLFPTHSYFGKESLSPHIVTLKGLARTFKNTYRLLRLPLKKIEYFSDLLAAQRKDITETEQNASSLEWATLLTRAYSHVFVVNLLAGKTYVELELILKGSPVTALEALSSACGGKLATSSKHLPPKAGDVSGNSLNIADESIFMTKKENAEDCSDVMVQKWLMSLQKRERVFIEKKIRSAREYAGLREVGRWVTVECLSGLRKALQREFIHVDKNRDVELLYHATLDEIQKRTWEREVLIERKKEYLAFCEYTLPWVISSLPKNSLAATFGVSPGIAEGVVAVSTKDVVRGSILFVDTLRPDLVATFDKIGGIISRKGNVLSHLAIVAREYGIPVVVDGKNAYREGQMVRIDGKKGEVLVRTGDNFHP